MNHLATSWATRCLIALRPEPKLQASVQVRTVETRRLELPTPALQTNQMSSLDIPRSHVATRICPSSASYNPVIVSSGLHRWLHAASIRSVFHVDRHVFGGSGGASVR